MNQLNHKLYKPKTGQPLLSQRNGRRLDVGNLNTDS